MKSISTTAVCGWLVGLAVSLSVVASAATPVKPTLETTLAHNKRMAAGLAAVGYPQRTQLQAKIFGAAALRLQRAGAAG